MCPIWLHLWNWFFYVLKGACTPIIAILIPSLPLTSHVSSYLLKIELVSFINSIFKNLFFFYHIKYRRKAINLTVHCVFWPSDWTTQSVSWNQCLTIWSMSFFMPLSVCCSWSKFSWFIIYSSMCSGSPHGGFLNPYQPYLKLMTWYTMFSQYIHNAWGIVTTFRVSFWSGDQCPSTWRDPALRIRLFLKKYIFMSFQINIFDVQG